MVFDGERAVDCSENFPEDYSGEILCKSSLVKGREELKVIAISLVRKGHFIQNLDHQKPIGHLREKIEQFNILGICPVLVSHLPSDRNKLTNFPEYSQISQNDWDALSSADRTEFIRDKVRHVLQKA